MLEGKFASEKLRVLPIFSDSHCMMLMKTWFLHLFSIRHVLVSYICSRLLSWMLFRHLSWYICMWKSLSRVQLLVTPKTISRQATPSMGFSRQEYWSGCHFLLQGIFPVQGSNSGFLHCRHTLYCLSLQGGPFWGPRTVKLLLEMNHVICTNLLLKKKKKKTFPSNRFIGRPRWCNGKKSTCQARDSILIPGLGRSPGEGNGNHSGILAWEIPWTEEPRRLQSMGLQELDMI